MNTDKEKHIPNKLPMFYKEVITSWHECGGGKKTPQNAADIRKEIIWGNKHILCKGKLLYLKHWKKSNINFIDDLVDNKGNFLKGEEILRKLKYTANWIGEYSKIISCIPTSWKDKLKTGIQNIKVKKSFRPFLDTGRKQIFDLPNKAKGYYEILIKKRPKKEHTLKNTGKTCSLIGLNGLMFT